MISKETKKAMNDSSAIRRLFVAGQQLAEKYGAENVYDFSLGNPVTPVPECFTNALRTLIDTESSLALHGYTNNAGYTEVRKKISDNLNKRFKTDFSENEIVMTVGAAGALNVVFKALLDAGDEVIVFAPYFSEYRGYVRNSGGSVVEVKPDPETFMPDMADFRSKITEKTKAVIINNPVNPSGVIYDEETVKSIAKLLCEKEVQYGHEIYLISDEPYRELVYDGKKVPFLTLYYPHTIVGYSFSKSMSIPGERIGYLAVSNKIENLDELMAALTFANRSLGFVNAPSLLQKAVAECLDAPVNIEFYDANRRLLYDGLTKLGFECVYPEGAFYMLVKSPVPDDKEFSDYARENHHLLLVSCTTFAYPGYVRLAYCVQPDMIKRSFKEFEKLAKHYF